MLSIDDFKIDRQVFEARFLPSYLLWDRSGEMWSLIVRDFDDLKLVNAVPNSVQFESDLYYLVVETNLLRITSRDNPSFEEFKKKTSSFLQAAIKFLDIEVFTRLGFRTIWNKEYSSMAETCDAFAELNLFRKFVPESFGLNKGNPTTEFKTTWEDARQGLTLMLRTEKRRADPQIPWEFRNVFNLKAVEKYVMAVDVDSYTVPQIRIEQLEISEWLNSSYRHSKKALKKGVFE